MPTREQYLLHQNDQMSMAQQAQSSLRAFAQ